MITQVLPGVWEDIPDDDGITYTMLQTVPLNSQWDDSALERRVNLEELVALAEQYLQGDKAVHMELQGEDLALRLYRILLKRLGFRDKRTRHLMFMLVDFYKKQGQLLEACSIVEEALLRNQDIPTKLLDLSTGFDWNKVEWTEADSALIETRTLDYRLIEHIKEYSYQGKLMALVPSQRSEVYWEDSRLYLRQIARVEFKHHPYGDSGRVRDDITEQEDGSITLVCPYVSYGAFRQSPIGAEKLLYTDFQREEERKVVFGHAPQSIQEMREDSFVQKDITTNKPEGQARSRMPRQGFGWLTSPFPKTIEASKNKGEMIITAHAELKVCICLSGVL